MGAFWQSFVVWLRRRLNEREVLLSRKLRREIETLAQKRGRPVGEVTYELLLTSLEQQLHETGCHPAWETLTRRERDIAALTALGYSNQQIADRLILSIETVRTHLRSVLRKYGVHSKKDLRAALGAQDFAMMEKHIEESGL
jgi:DNA-binding CsgD family transcriptional regulator